VTICAVLLHNYYENMRFNIDHNGLQDIPDQYFVAAEVHGLAVTLQHTHMDHELAVDDKKDDHKEEEVVVALAAAGHNIPLEQLRNQLEL